MEYKTEYDTTGLATVTLPPADGADVIKISAHAADDKQIKIDGKLYKLPVIATPRQMEESEDYYWEISTIDANEITSEHAIALYNTGWWNGKSDEDIIRFQLFAVDGRLCMPGNLFHQILGKVLKRSVFIHEFSTEVGWENLQKEFLGERPAPTFQEICNLIPEAKRIIWKRRLI